MTSKCCLVIQKSHSTRRKNPIKHLHAPCFAAEHDRGIVSGLETSVAEVQNELPVQIEANCMFDFRLPQPPKCSLGSDPLTRLRSLGTSRFFETN
jgi:hypothetical protein